MKVGRLLSGEMKNMPRLKYPFKIRKDQSQDTFSETKIYESISYINNCKSFIKKILKSTSLKKNVKKLLSPKFNEYSFYNNSNNSDKQIFPTIKAKRIKSCNKNTSYKCGSTKNNSRKRNYSSLQTKKTMNLNNIKLSKIFLKNNDPLLTMQDDTDKETKILQKIFDLRIERKFRSINKITDRLNKPLFLFTTKDNFKEKIYNKTDNIKKFYRF